MSGDISIDINLRSVCLLKLFSDQADQPLQARYQKKAVNPVKVEIMFLRPYDQ